MTNISKSKIKKNLPVSKSTKLASIEIKYGVDFGAKSDMTVKAYLKEIGYSSLSSMIAN